MKNEIEIVDGLKFQLSKGEDREVFTITRIKDGFARVVWSDNAIGTVYGVKEIEGYFKDKSWTIYNS